jgi:CRP-like cAMP-binding protein
VALNFFRPNGTTPRLEQLRSLSLFVDLTPAELRIVDGLLHERDYVADEVIFDQGDEGQAIYIVVEGEVLIRRQGQGDKGRLALLTPGKFFGELALLDDEPRAAQAVAATNCRLAVFFRADFLGLLDTHALVASKIGRQLARHIGRRMRELALSVGELHHL